MKQKKPPSIKELLATCRRPFIFAALFSSIINLLLLASPIYSLQIYDRVLSSGSIETLGMLSIIVLGSFIFYASFQLIRSFIFLQISSWTDRKLTLHYVLGIIRLNALQANQVFTQPIRDVGTIKSFINGQTIQHLFDAPWAIIFLVALYFLHPLIGIMVTLSALTLLLLAFINDWQTKAAIVTANEIQMSNINQLNYMVKNAIAIESMGMARVLSHRWQVKNNASIDAQNHSSKRTVIMGQLTKTIRMAIQVMIMGVSAYLVLNNKMTSGGIIAASILSGKALLPFDQAISTWKSVVSTSQAYQRLVKLESEIPIRDDAMTLPAPAGKLSVESLSFTFLNQSKPFLKGISFEIDEGDIIGLIGPSASGKSTLSKLLVGIWKPTQGVVRLDHANIYDWNRVDIGQYVGYLSQEIELFNGTIQENIARMDPDADSNQVINAAKITGCHEMILSLPQGYDTVLLNGGEPLSLGQRQRIGLARAFFGHPRLVVLDEPNAHLDQVGEKALLNVLNYAKQTNITVIIVSHRTSITAQLDKIMVLNQGMIQQYGPKDEVLKQVLPAVSGNKS
ncbi:MAG: type I secretion system permease/ATPase [Candidatus Marinamargulisbacteria bacterium]